MNNGVVEDDEARFALVFCQCNVKSLLKRRRKIFQLRGHANVLIESNIHEKTLSKVGPFSKYAFASTENTH